MKKYRSVFLLLIAALFLSGRIEQTANRDSNSNSSNNLLSGSIISADTSIYDVRFSFKGYQTFNGDTTNCPIRPAGTVVLKGLLKGIEDISGTDDVFYEGTLQLDIDIDICSVKGEGDNAKPCSITITGSGLVKTELQVYYDKRGGYIQIRDTTSRGLSKKCRWHMSPR